MRISLYKGCILTANYQEVFDTKIREGHTTSTFEDYLATLDRRDYDINSFLTDSGSFNIGYSVGGLEALSCNYLKITDGSRIIYAFVDSVVRSNSCVTVNYTVDVFHTYFPVCSLRDSLICNSTNINIGTRAELPLEYDSNNPFLIYKTKKIGVNGKVRIVARLSWYTLSSDNQSNRVTFFGILTKLDENQQDVGELEIKEAIEIIDKVKNLQGQQHLNYLNNKFWYELSDIYLIPSAYYDKLNLSDDFPITATTLLYGPYIETGTVLTDKVYFLIPAEVAVVGETPFTGDEKIINKNIDLFNNETLDTQDFTVIGIGNITSMIRIEHNNTKIIAKLGFYLNKYEFSLTLRYANKFIDITSDYEIEVPYQSITGEVAVQRQLAKKMGIMNGIGKIAGNAIKIGTNLINRDLYEREAGLGALTYNFTEFSRPQIASNNLLGGAIGGVLGIADGIKDIIYANKAKYQNSYGCQADSIGGYNAINGIVLFAIEPDNINEVKNAINEIGYNVFIKGDIDYGRITTRYIDPEVSNEIEQVENNFNTIRFSNAKVVGLAPQNILLQIKQILENGVKVWYTTNVS